MQEVIFRTCDGCGREFRLASLNQRYCGPRCRRRGERQRAQARDRGVDISAIRGLRPSDNGAGHLLNPSREQVLLLCLKLREGDRAYVVCATPPAVPEGFLVVPQVDAELNPLGKQWQILREPQGTASPGALAGTENAALPQGICVPTARVLPKLS